jgi:hypothetical protein
MYFTPIDGCRTRQQQATNQERTGENTVESGRTHGNPIEHALVRQRVVLVDELESKSAGVAKSWRIWRGIKVGTDKLLKMISDVIDSAHHLSDAGSTRLRYLECG